MQMVSQTLSGAFFTVTKWTVKKLGKKWRKYSLTQTGNFRIAFGRLGEKLNKMCVYNDLLAKQY